jgi:hypothetical protein
MAELFRAEHSAKVSEPLIDFIVDISINLEQKRQKGGHRFLRKSLFFHSSQPIPDNVPAPLSEDGIPAWDPVFIHPLAFKANPYMDMSPNISVSPEAALSYRFRRANP